MTEKSSKDQLAIVLGVPNVSISQVSSNKVAQKEDDGLEKGYTRQAVTVSLSPIDVRIELKATTSTTLPKSDPDSLNPDSVPMEGQFNSLDSIVNQLTGQSSPTPITPSNPTSSEDQRKKADAEQAKRTMFALYDAGAFDGGENDGIKLVANALKEIHHEGEVHILQERPQPDQSLPEIQEIDELYQEPLSTFSISERIGQIVAKGSLDVTSSQLDSYAVTKSALRSATYDYRAARIEGGRVDLKILKFKTPPENKKAA